MAGSDRSILVFGATGQQGGSVARALLASGWTVRAFVRDAAGEKAGALRRAGAVTVEGRFGDREAIMAAMQGAYGVFSVQPSSGQGEIYGVSDAQEVAWGIQIADLAVACGLHHLVYSSANAVGDKPTGLGHFDSKARIEAHIRTLPIAATILRPAAFMEMLTMPGFGLPEGQFNFFARPDQAMQLLAVPDIGKIVAAVLADPERFAGRTMEVASDTVTGQELAQAFTQAAGRPIAYRRFPDTVLDANPFLAALAGLFDDGRLTGSADLTELRAMVPSLQDFGTWIRDDGREAFEQASRAKGSWAYGPAS
ncbi:NmrA/HSCARG family protein [Endobacter medicaginis]|uniref:NmrA/HSCARG family protein n=1 Tax=Endobacter medicaginis TaxID=1181271 RepID=A0A850NP32_9PROT|nr:NmrA/HSCARG family protein [Endobacter medicaginis]MCX5475668.1 NmrA/HSCARG family protein [Endobacter medicaginis]NVN29810.1 NmrA/HSCARG family protein [Endobacter medicaginis]